MTIVFKNYGLLPELLPRTKETNYNRSVPKQLQLPFGNKYEVAKGFVESGE
jgi:hypothetical protein